MNPPTNAPRWGDLHMHTYFSDGTASPEEVITDALKAQLACISITDHDTIDGVALTQQAAQGHDIEVISGIELSSEFEGKDIHMLGYGFDINKGPLVDKLDQFLDGRVARMKQMLMNLSTVGIKDIDYDEIALMTKSRAVGRAHLATALITKGHVASFKEAFDKYIGEGKPGFAPKFNQTPFEAIELLKQSGGVAVMAHPMLTQKDELIPRLVQAGMGGLEVYYPNCSDAVISFYEKIGRKHGLILTGGSDAHGKAKPYTHIGKAVVAYDNIEALKRLFA